MNPKPMQNSALNYPTVVFWYAVITGVHETPSNGGKSALWQYAQQTILNTDKARSFDERQKIEWLLWRDDLAQTKAFRDEAWSFARDFVLSGRAAEVFTSCPDPLGHLAVTPEGVAERVELHKRKRKTKPRAYDSWDCDPESPF